MKKQITFFLFIFLGISTFIMAQEVVYFDFGALDKQMPSSSNWNNITGPLTTSPVVNLVDDQGTSTGYSLTITKDFQNGANSDGSAGVDAAAIFPLLAGGDSFFGTVNEFLGVANVSSEFTLSGLNSSKYYSFIIYAARKNVTDNREALYAITGENGQKSAALNASNNTSNVATIFEVKPTASGNIVVSVTAGPNNTNSAKFYYLGAIQMTRSDVPTNVPNNLELNLGLYYSNGAICGNNLTGHVKIHDLTGKLVVKGEVIEGKLSVKLLKGIYVLSSDAGKTKFIVN